MIWDVHSLARKGRRSRPSRGKETWLLTLKEYITSCRKRFRWMHRIWGQSAGVTRPALKLAPRPRPAAATCPQTLLKARDATRCHQGHLTSQALLPEASPYSKRSRPWPSKLTTQEHRHPEDAWQLPQGLPATLPPLSPSAPVGQPSPLLRRVVPAVPPAGPSPSPG